MLYEEGRIKEKEGKTYICPASLALIPIRKLDTISFVRFIAVSSVSAATSLVRVAWAEKEKNSQCCEHDSNEGGARCRPIRIAKRAYHRVGSSRVVTLVTLELPI